MNKKEIKELRTRLKPERSTIQHIYGCYVNSQKEVIAEFDEPVGLLTKEEEEKYIGLLKKTLSGGLGRNLMDISFSTKQVMDSDEHRLLSALRKTELKDRKLLRSFYDCVIENFRIEDTNYLILMAYDSYDVPKKDKNGEDAESDEVFNYILCCICPVKTNKPVLSYSSEESRFHQLSISQIVANPEIGFMFPAFDYRAANIYNAVFYSRDTKGMHDEFIDAVFRTEVPLSPAQQKEAFSETVKQTLSHDCSLEVLSAVHEELREKIEQHKESGDPEEFTLSVEEVEELLEKSGMSEEKKKVFESGCRERFGEGKRLTPENIIDSRKFEIRTETVKIQIDPKFSSLVKTKVIDGHKYILIPADAGAEVNGISVEI